MRVKTMLADSELKLNRFYWCEVIDKAHPCFKKEYRVKFTGIAFRNAEYLNEQKDITTDAEVVLRRIKNNVMKTPDEYFFRSQIRIYREAPADLFNGRE